VLDPKRGFEPPKHDNAGLYSALEARDWDLRRDLRDRIDRGHWALLFEPSHVATA
jgi:hypothetical protein